MSNANDKLVDEYLSGANPYSQRYRRVAADDVPPDLDGAVLKLAAQRATQTQTQWWRRVGPPLAVAATAVLAVTVLMRSNVESPVATTAVSVEETDRVTVDDSQKKLRAVAEPAPSAFAPATAPPAGLVDSRELQSRAETVRSKVEAKKEPVQFARAQEPARALSPAVRPEEKSAGQAAEVSRGTRQLYDKDKAASADERVGMLQRSNQSAADSSIADAFSAPAASPAAPAKTDQLAERRADSLGSKGTPTATTTNVSEVVVTRAQIRSARNPILPFSVVSNEEKYHSDPVGWLRYIRELRKDGKNEEADEQWEKFVELYPKYSVKKNDTARPKN